MQLIHAQRFIVLHLDGGYELSGGTMEMDTSQSVAMRAISPYTTLGPRPAAEKQRSPRADVRRSAYDRRTDRRPGTWARHRAASRRQYAAIHLGIRRQEVLGGATSAVQVRGASKDRAH